MVSKCVNKTLFLNRDGVRLHRMKFYIYECPERGDLKSMIQERCGIVVETKGKHVVCFATQSLDLEDGEIFSTEYIKQCCEKNMLLDLKNFRLGKNPDCSNVDPLEVLKGVASWPQNTRCFRNTSKNNSVNELMETEDSELCPQKRKRSTRKRSGMEQERRLCHWRRTYSRKEDVKIIRYLLKNNNYKKAGTNTLWKNMELQEVLRDRSWQSMKNRLRIIRLHPERYDLSDEDIKKIGGKTAAGSSNSLKVSVDKGKCCFCCPKMDLAGCEVADGSDNVRYCHCSQLTKRQAKSSLENEALVPDESIGRKFCSSIQSQATPRQKSCDRKEKPLAMKHCHTNRAESFSYASSTLSDDETEIESEPKHCFEDTVSPFHKTRNQVTVKNGAQPNQKRKLYILPSSGINISIKSRDISLLKNNSARKEFSIPLRWPQIFTPVNSAIFEKQVTESDTVGPEALNHKTQNPDRYPGDRNSTVYGSCQSHETENGSATYSSKSMLPGEGIRTAAAIDQLTNITHPSHSSRTEDTLPDKGQKPLNVRSHSTSKNINKRERRTSVNDGVCILECGKSESVKNRMEMEEDIVSPSFSISELSSAFDSQMRGERSTDCVNDCINDRMSSEYCELQTSKSNKAQHESEFGITNMLHADRLQDEESPIKQHTTAQGVRPVPEKDISSSPTHYQEQSNDKQQSSSGSLAGGDSVVYGNKHCQHVSNYKDFYVKQWLNSVVHYYKNGNISKLPSFSEKLKETTVSSEQDNHNSKNIISDNLDEETSCAATYVKKSSCVHKEISKIDDQEITESCCGAEDSDSAVKNEFIFSNSSKIHELKDKSVCIIGTSERLHNKDLAQISSVGDLRKMTLTVPNATETPDKNVVRESIFEPPNQHSTADSKDDNVCHIQSYVERISSLNSKNCRDEPFLQISHVTSLCCEHNQEQCYEESCDSGDVVKESQTSQVTNDIHLQFKYERSISITNEDSILESLPSQDHNFMPISIKQEKNVSIEEEEFRYEGYSPPVDFLAYMPDNV